VRTPDELTAAFRAQGMKVTPQRQLLFRLLHGNTVHPSADALYAVAHEAMPGISLRTVYQTLSELAAMGELQILEFGPGPSRFDPNTSDHHHALCIECGEMRDVHVADVDHLSVAGLDGFSVENTAIVLSGRCRACSSAHLTNRSLTNKE
jgi:Fe2+ or Zn2+ uptake regulation protein